MTHDHMNYMAIYSRLITTRKLMSRIKNETTRYDWHHIYPRCLTRHKTKRKCLSDDRSSNLVLLTLKEHYIAHRLLAKICPESSGCIRAVAFMTRTGMKIKGSKSYVLVMSKLREDLVAWNTEQTAAGTHPLKRPEAIANATATRNKQHLERKARGEYLFSAETRKQSSDRMTKYNNRPGQKQVMVSRNTKQATCEHCQVTGAKMAMLQWHWSNCLEHPDNLGLNRKQIKQRKLNNA